MEEPVSGADAYSEWQERLQRFESSGLSIDVFCQQEDVDQSAFLDWLRVLRREQFRPPAETRSTEDLPFVPVTVRTSSKIVCEKCWRPLSAGRRKGHDHDTNR